MSATYLTVECEVQALIDEIEATPYPREAAGFATEWLSVHYDIDTNDLARRFPPSAARPGDREALVLEQLRAVTQAVALESRVSYATLDAIITLLATCLKAQPDSQGAAAWATNRLIAATGIDGVVHDPTDSDPLTVAVKYMRAASALLHRQLAIRSGAEDIPF